MLSYVQAIILGLVQGVTELFPVSASGHAILVIDLFGWSHVSAQYEVSTSSLISLLTISALLVSAVLFGFYRTEWMRIGRGISASVRSKNLFVTHDAKLGWIIVVATGAAACFTFLFGSTVREQFTTGFFAIVFLIANGILLIKGDARVITSEINRPRRRRGAAPSELAAARTSRTISDRLTLGRAALIGLAQCGGLFAGFSRTGISMVLGLRSGFDHTDAARFAFLLAAPVLFVSSLVHIPSAIASLHGSNAGPLLVGSLVAGAAALWAVRFLDRYFKKGTLKPFGLYCIGFAVLALVVSIIRGAS